MGSCVCGCISIASVRTTIKIIAIKSHRGREGESQGTNILLVVEGIGKMYALPPFEQQ